MNLFFNERVEMGLSTDYLKFVASGKCNLVGSPNGTVQYVDRNTCAVVAVDEIAFYNMRTLEKIGSVLREGKLITAFKLSPDRSLLAAGYNDGELHLHNRHQGSAKGAHAIFAGHRTGVNCIAFSRDGLVLATGGKDSAIVVWDVASELGICRLNGHKSTVTHLEFVQNSRFIVSSSKDTHIRFWDLNSKSCFYTLAESTSEVYTFALLDSGRLLVVGSADIELMVFELNWNNQVDSDEFGGEEEEKNSKRFKKRDLLIGSEQIEEEPDLQQNRILRCKKRGSLIRQAKGRALQISVSSDESIFCCIGSDALLDVYRHFSSEESTKRFNKKLRKMRQKLDIKEGEDISKLNSEVSKDVTTLITRIGDFRADSKIKWMDLCDSFTPLEDDKFREYRFFCLLSSNDVQGVTLKIDWKSNAVESTPLVSLGQRFHRSDVRTLSIASNASFFVSGSLDSAIVWDLSTLQPVNKLVAEGLSQLSASLIVPNNKQAVFGTRGGSLFLFDLQSCDLMERQEGVHADAISSFCAFPDQNGFLSCGHDKKAIFWSYENIKGSADGRNLLTIKSSRVLELPDEPLCASISPNGKFLVFGLLDNTARVYYMDSMNFFVSLYGHSLPVYCTDISLDSKLVVTGSADKSVKIWGLDFGDCHRSLFAHDDIVTCVRFNKTDGDERVFWSAGKDGKLKQWDASKFHRIQTLEGHSGEIDAISTTLDGNILISASRDKSIRIWELSDEIIVLQEEQEKEREKEYEQRLIDMEDIIPGMTKEAEQEIAALKSIETVKSTESILEAIELIRNERAEREQDSTHKVHPLLLAYPRDSEHLFLMDSILKIRYSHLEKSLMAVPFGYVPDLLREMCKCAKIGYKPEVASRVVLFLIRIHHNQITASYELLHLVDELKDVLPTKAKEFCDQIGFNIAALKFLQMRLEQKKQASLFSLSAVEAEKEAKKRRRNKKKAGRDFAFVTSIR